MPKALTREQRLVIRRRARRRTLFRKANDLWQDFGSKITVLVEEEGQLYAYRSHADNWPSMEEIITPIVRWPDTT
ncbi:MAG: hypothetical protein M1823_001724 [Watsoniomyces obsoletus]|nr:MAG: hypothetical protein M1823_001724 [Watsoniomyces obsoletus]